MNIRKVLLIGWDAADWEHITPLLDEGLMPTLEALISRGMMGNLATLHPILSPMLWNSIATGKFADKHGVHGFIEPDPINGGARPYTSTSRKCKALWNILTQSGLRSNVIGWWASHPAEPINGTVVTNAFGGVKFHPDKGWVIPKGTVYPPEKGAELARYKIFPGELTEAHVLPFIPEAAKIDQQEDSRLNSFATVLSDNASIHAVATAVMESEPWDFTAVYYDGIDHFSHAFMAYHPPKLDWVKEEDFAIYKDVVRGAYRFHDMMLERLIELAGPEATVILCSDHGFESGAQRPMATPREPAGPAAWHRQYGILVMAGPGIKRDERLYGASLVDITPTVLTLFNLPIGKDMDGRPLLEAFETTPDVKTIESWDKKPGESGMHPKGVVLEPDQSRELMEQFAALGYIEEPGTDKEKAAASAEIEAKYNLARAYLWKGQADQARLLLEEIVRRRPWEERFLGQLAASYFQCGYLRQAERVLAAIANENEPDSPVTLLLLAKIKLARGDLGGALQGVIAAQAMNPQTPSIQTQIGDVFARLLQWREAKRAYEAAITLDEDNALAFQGLSSVYRRLGQNQETAEMALRAVGLLHRLPLAHFNLGVAMARSGENERAILAFETALRFQPNMINAHRYLAMLYHQQGGDLEKARHHQSEAATLASRRPQARKFESDRSEKVFDLPEIPNRQQRLKILLRERPDPKPPEKKSGKTFIIVSGLPRSGTSLMMQMLGAGGLTILTDHERAADPDNPKGYYEWEPIKQIGKEPGLLDEEDLEGRGLKCVSMLLPQLPLKHNYKVIFMTRPIQEVVASQEQMIDRLGARGASIAKEDLARGLTAHRDETLAWLKRAPHMEFIEIDYPALTRNPDPVVKRLVEFIGREKLPNVDAIAAVIDPSLHRHRS
jgi:predicted AlkP superfamily phosphohydrolase/phosphomutase/tetratricopeptide (TPR) repeat protein